MKANDYQIGGNHYSSDYAHWDLIGNLYLGYLEGCTTKYVCRWRRKAGKEDLKKALHFLNKLAETYPTRFLQIPYATVVAEVKNFSRLNKLSGLESAYVLNVAGWQHTEDLNGARELLFLLLDEAEALEKAPTPVPLSEENHHAERVGKGDQYWGS